MAKPKGKPKAKARAKGRADRSERYSKVSRRIWNDQKFRQLSPIPPCGQGLVFRLLVAPECNVIPGLFQAWEAGLAQALKWPLEAFQDAFAEAQEKGIVEADWEAGLVWLPNGVKHNEPQSLNVVKGWAVEWRELPECELKDRALAHLKSYCEDMSEAFGQVFGEAFADAIAKASSKPSLKARAIQEQEQEQEQEQDPPTEEGEPPPPPLDTERETLCPPNLAELFTGYAELAKHLGVTEDVLRAGAREFVGYWTVGEGVGRKRNHWARLLRKDLMRKDELGKLAARRPAIRTVGAGPSPEDL